MKYFVVSEDTYYKKYFKKLAYRFDWFEISKFITTQHPIFQNVVSSIHPVDANYRFIYLISAEESEELIYLNKPFTLNHFIQAIGQNSSNHISNQDVFWIPQGNRIEMLKINEILFIEKIENLTLVKMRNGKHFNFDNNLGKLENILNSDFCQANANTFIQSRAISYMEKDILNIQDHIIQIENKYRKDLINKIIQYY